MGYDMHWRKADPSEAAALAAAREVWNKAIAVRDELPDDESGTRNLEKMRKVGIDAHEAYDGRTDRYREAQDRVMAASRAMHDAEQSYFRLNMFGMGAFTDVMYELGMLFEDDPHPDWPRYEDYGITQEQAEVVEYPDYPSEITLTDEQRAAVEKFLAEQHRILSWHGKADTPGIPAHKFGSNDGWIVLPVECQAALALYMAKVEEMGQEAVENLIDNKLGNRGRWAQWLAYLNGAISHDGFEVH